LKNGIAIIVMLFTVQMHAQKKYMSQNYYSTIENKAVFDELKGEPLSNLYSGIECVKLCYHIATQKLYFMNSTRFRFHIDFCEKIFGDTYDIAEFNKTNYTINDDRKYILSTLNYYTNQNIYTLEFVSEDNVPLVPLQEMYKALSSNINLGSPVKILLNNAYLIDKKLEMNPIPIIFPETIFKAQSYQPLVLGDAVGVARRIKNLKKEYNSILPNDIIFIHGTPLALPNCKAVFTNTMQTPLSHINVLCNNRKTPACAYTLFDSLFANTDLQNQQIFISVQADKVIIRKAKGTEGKIVKKIAKKNIVLQSDGITKKLELFSVAKNSTPKNIGSKAFGVAQLYTIKKRFPGLYEVPACGFGIPFYYYIQHMKNSKIQLEYKKLLRIPIQYNDSVNAQLSKLRKAIKKAPIDNVLINSVASLLRKNDSTVSYRFRSSSNAEDIEGFNGAGLYESYTGTLYDSNKTIANAIKKVWASVWTENAYQERTLFGIDNRTVLMGILVHQGFPAEEANGVAITKNMYRQDFPGFTINVQKGEVSVVAPDDSITCDQFICFSSQSFYAEQGEIYEQYITRSNINNGVNVLNHAEVAKLFYALDKIKNYLYYRNANNFTKYNYDDFALDLEFKFDDGKLFIKQVRSYK
jgi:pyruvate, water dikinase